MSNAELEEEIQKLKTELGDLRSFALDSIREAIDEHCSDCHGNDVSSQYVDREIDSALRTHRMEFHPEI